MKLFYMVLKAKYKVTSKFKGVTKFQFFKNIEIDDILEVKLDYTIFENDYERGKPILKVTNITKNTSFSGVSMATRKRLSCLGLEEIKE